MANFLVSWTWINISHPITPQFKLNCSFSSKSSSHMLPSSELVAYRALNVFTRVFPPPILLTACTLWEGELVGCGTFSCPEPMILLACGRDWELWPDLIFWVCTEYSFHILNQSDLTESPWIMDLQCWTKPELSIPAKNGCGKGFFCPSQNDSWLVAFK